MKENSKEKWKREILDTEKEFAEMAQRKGIKMAFVTFAADDAVLLRNDTLIFGKDAILDFFNSANLNSNETSLLWEPDFVDVSESGDLGYTFGKYQYLSKDSMGTLKESTGVFQTVWKKQKDGSWKFVWD